ncbi:hypothetical protein BX666DRAFT_677523 [Dichotomocladium elegans]|nr:hypothetical protein BX666DRAFT_677523 [Dichotomocladium elegans]
MADGDMIERKGGQIAFMLSSAALSILCSLVVLLAFFFILWYRPPMANRITLRLIVLSCFCNLIYCLVGLPTTVVGDKTMACRVLIFFMIGADTMASMCLAMVGVHLVVVFVIRAKYPERKEKYYYTFIVASAIITVVVPAATTVGPTATMNTSCWFRYLYVGRAQRTFKWASEHANLMIGFFFSLMSVQVYDNDEVYIWLHIMHMHMHIHNAIDVVLFLASARHYYRHYLRSVGHCQISA